MLFQNILVPYDGSKFSIHALKVALDIAKKYKAKITIISVFEKSFSRGWTSDHRFVESINKTLRKKTADILIQAQEIVKKNHYKDSDTQIIGSDNIVKEIVRFAKTRKIDLIVMGTKGTSGWNKLLIGSVASGVSQQVHCPVLLNR